MVLGRTRLAGLMNLGICNKIGSIRASSDLLDGAVRLYSAYGKTAYSYINMQMLICYW